MASIKVKFRPSAVAGREGSVYYQIIHDRKVRQLISDQRMTAAEWLASQQSAPTAAGAGEHPALTRSVRQAIRNDLDRLSRITCRLDSTGLPYTADDIVESFNLYVSQYSLFNFMNGIITRLRANGKLRTSETYTATLNSFRKFCGCKDIMIDCMTPALMESYEAWLRQRMVAPNTISFYNRVLRAVYNRAVEQGVTDDSRPFRHVYTGIDKTVKRALPLPAIRRIKALDLSFDPVLDYARDMFMMSFYLRGMSLIDMAFLHKSDLRDGSVTYRRRKTGQQLVIGWTGEMQHIIDKYPENSTGYLLPIIRRPGTNERCTYRNVGYNINRSLKKIAVMIDVHIPLTLYVARHSWASAARTKGIPLNVISEGMGHSSESTTRIYLASLDTSVIDRANALILSSL